MAKQHLSMATWQSLSWLLQQESMITWDQSVGRTGLQTFLQDLDATSQDGAAHAKAGLFQQF